MRPQQIAHLLNAEEAFWLAPSPRWELVEGRIVELSPVKKRHGRILARLVRRMEELVERDHLGETYAGDVGFILHRNPDTVRAPDLAFVTTARLPDEAADESAGEEVGFSTVVPDLAVEILSPSDRWTDVEQKISEYLAAGVKVVWIVDAKKNQVHVHRPGIAVEILGKADALECRELLPAFRLSLAELLA